MLKARLLGKGSDATWPWTASGAAPGGPSTKCVRLVLLLEEGAMVVVVEVVGAGCNSCAPPGGAKLTTPLLNEGAPAACPDSTLVWRPQHHQSPQHATNLHLSTCDRMAAAVDDARHGSAARFTLVAMPAAITTTTATNTAAIAAQWPAVWQLHLQPQPHPQQQRRLLQRQQQLHFRFTAAAQPNATAVVPFAWLGGSRWGRPHELFTLSRCASRKVDGSTPLLSRRHSPAPPHRNTSGGLSSDATTISISARASSGSASGYESDSDGEVGFSSDLHLDM
jgi:hypothetical protein